MSARPMVTFAGQVVSIVGRLGTVANRDAAAAVEDLGGVVRRGLSQRTRILVVGRNSLGQLEDGRLHAKLARADRLGAVCLSERRFLVALGLRAPPPAVAGAADLTELGAKTGLDDDTIRVLILYDVIAPEDERCSFQDLIAAREVARLLGEGHALASVLRSAQRLERGANQDGHPLARLKLASDEQGRIVRRIGDCLAELDGQLRLPLPADDNPSVDELFETAEEVEQAGDWLSAAQIYRRCARLDQRDPIAPFNLANVLRELDRAAEAKLFLELALAIDPQFADAWYNLALLQEEAGDRNQARRSLERAIAADPDYGDPLYKLAYLQFEAGHFAEASRLWQRYLALDPDSDWSRRARDGLVLCQQQNP